MKTEAPGFQEPPVVADQRFVSWPCKTITGITPLMDSTHYQGKWQVFQISFAVGEPLSIATHDATMDKPALRKAFAAVKKCRGTDQRITATVVKRVFPWEMDNGTLLVGGNWVDQNTVKIEAAPER
jgi:hypothetical protein